MNKQGHKDNPAGGIEWTHFFGPGTGWTANPVRGCKHQCRWRMPDGTIAICYAETTAVKLAASTFPRGFSELSFDESELRAIEARQEPCGIFMDSMSDLFGNQVPALWIEAVLGLMQKCPQHVFFTLTKNPRRLIEFGPYPGNVLVGVSSPPTFMFGKELFRDQQLGWFDRALRWLKESGAPNRWVSLEPLSCDVSEVLSANRDAFHWAVIGAASNGRDKHQPALCDLKAALAVLAGLPVFYKGNISYTLAMHCGGWRAEFPRLRGMVHQNTLAL